MACRKMNEDIAYARNTESGCNGLFTNCPQRCQWSNNQHVNGALIKHPSRVSIEDIDCHLTTDAFGKKISIILAESMENTLETKAGLLFLPSN